MQRKIVSFESKLDLGRITTKKGELPIRLAYQNMECLVHPQGAKVLEFKVNGQNVLFHDPKDLKHSGIPICFPIFGAISEPLKINGRSYELSQHGFLRDMNCKSISQTENSVTYQLSSTPETFAKFPFHFEFNITYTMKNNTLMIDADITHQNSVNPITDQRMPIVLAFHPYFAVKNPDQVMVQTNGTTYFDNLLPENKKQFTKSSPIIGSTYLKSVSDTQYQVTGNPDIHITDHKSQSTILQPGISEYQLEIKWDKKFPYMTIWRPKATDPYICVEPATALKNQMVQTLNQGKEGTIQRLARGETKHFQIEIHVHPQ